MKKVVKYDLSKGVMNHPSGGVLLWPIDHPDSDRVSNASYVLTTKVIMSNVVTKAFETQNTIYLPNEEVYDA